MAAKKKLKLDKKTVTKLSADELRNIEGGIITSCSPINDCCGIGGGDDNGGLIKVTKDLIQF